MLVEKHQALAEPFAPLAEGKLQIGLAEHVEVALHFGRLATQQLDLKHPRHQTSLAGAAGLAHRQAAEGGGSGAQLAAQRIKHQGAGERLHQGGNVDTGAVAGQALHHAAAAFQAAPTAASASTGTDRIGDQQLKAACVDGRRDALVQGVGS